MLIYYLPQILLLNNNKKRNQPMNATHEISKCIHINATEYISTPAVGRQMVLILSFFLLRKKQLSFINFECTVFIVV